MSFPDLTITSLETITAYDVVTGDYKFTLDELQNTSIAQTQDKVDMTGKGGRKLNSLKRNKAVTISGANGMVSGGLLEMQTGGTFEDGFVAEEIAPTYSTLSSMTIYMGDISSSTSSNKVVYFACEPNTKYEITATALAYGGWTTELPANGVHVYDWQNQHTGNTFTTGSSAAYIAFALASSADTSSLTVNEFVDAGYQVAWNEYLTVKTGPQHQYCSMTYKAVGTAGSEIVGLYKRNSDGTLGAPFTQVASNEQFDTGTFVYNKTNDWLLFYEDDVAEGDEIVVFYNRMIKADRLINYSDVFSGKAALYIDALAEDKCANIYRVQFFIPKADFNGEFTFELGDNQTVHNFEAEALAGACGTAGQLWTFTVFGVNAEDAS